MPNADLKRPVRPETDKPALRRAAPAAAGQPTIDALCDNVLSLCERLKAASLAEVK